MLNKSNVHESKILHWLCQSFKVKSKFFTVCNSHFGIIVQTTNSKSQSMQRTLRIFTQFFFPAYVTHTHRPRTYFCGKFFLKNRHWPALIMSIDTAIIHHIPLHALMSYRWMIFTDNLLNVVLSAVHPNLRLKFN